MTVGGWFYPHTEHNYLLMDVNVNREKVTSETRRRAEEWVIVMEGSDIEEEDPEL